MNQPQTIGPKRGGTGSSSIPDLNDILIGDGTGKYTKISLGELKELLGFVGFGTMTVSDTEPANPQENDIWVPTL